MTDRSFFLRVYDRWYWLLIPVLFLLIYHRVFTAEYVYLDEAPQIHDRTGREVFEMFMGQGRPLSAWLNKTGFTGVSGVPGLRWLRIISLTGWIITAMIGSRLFARWTKIFRWDPRLRLLADVFMAGSLSVCIYIGWASCFQIFLAMLGGLLSAHCMVRYFFERDASDAGKTSGERPGNTILLIAAVLLSLGSLFIYQTGFGLFLLPFVLQYVCTGTTRPSRELRNALLFYLAMYALYYLLLQGMVHLAGIPLSERAGFTSRPLAKLGFLFSGPLPSAFSLNLLYSSGVLPVQILQYTIMAVWLILLGRSAQETAMTSRIIRAALVLGFIALIYLPSMIARENFASYRSLFPVAITVFLSFAMLLMQATPGLKWKNGLTVALLLFVAGSGAYSYNRQFVAPLVQEYNWYQMQIMQAASSGPVVVVRAGRQLFRDRDRVRAYKDEFGCPSTSRDWVPVPMIRQMMLERRNMRENKTVAGSASPGGHITSIPVFQVESGDSVRLRQIMDSLDRAPNTGKTLLLDINLAWKKD